MVRLPAGYHVRVRENEANIQQYVFSTLDRDIVINVRSDEMLTSSGYISRPLADTLRTDQSWRQGDYRGYRYVDWRMHTAATEREELDGVERMWHRGGSGHGY